MKKDYAYYSVEDFLLDDSFIAWVKNNDAAAAERWHSFLQLYPGKKNELNEARNLLQHLHFPGPLPDRERKERIWEEVINDSKVFNMSSSQPTGRRSFLRWAAGVAAAVLLAVAGIWYMDTATTITTNFGEIRNITLPDQSVVTLNGNSSVTYSSSWEPGTEREVWVEGDAFFDVQHIHKTGETMRPEHKFIVHVGEMNVEVLGTKFSVNDRREKTRVVLESGKIKLHFNDETKLPMDVKPGDMVELTKENQVIRKQVKPLHYNSWKEKIFVFERSPLKDVFQILEDNYGLNVQVADTAIYHETISGTIPAGNRQLLLEALSAALSLEFQLKENDLLIRSN